MTIHAYTEPHNDYPAFVNLSERAHGLFALTVRSQGDGGRNVGVINLTRQDLMNLVNDASKHLGADPQATKNAAAAKSMAEVASRASDNPSLRAHAIEMALRTPGIGNHREVLAAATAYQAHIVGEATAPAQQQPAPGAAHAGYSTMQPHQQRVVDERADLDARLAKLGAFFETPIFSSLDADEQWRLRQQHDAMAAYSGILSMRITAFAPAHHPV